jgi:hypothetical protein
MARPLRIEGFAVWLDLEPRAQPRLGPRELANRIADYLATDSRKRPRF